MGSKDMKGSVWVCHYELISSMLDWLDWVRLTTTHVLQDILAFLHRLMCLKSCFHSLKSCPIQVNVSQSFFHYLNNYSSLIILSMFGGWLKLISYIISSRRIPLLAGIPLCKSQGLSWRDHSMSRLCSIHHDIPVTMHTLAAYGQWSVFDHSGGNQSAVLWDKIWDLVALVWPMRSRVITTSSALVRCWNFFGGPSVGFTRYRSLPCTATSHLVWTNVWM